MGGRVALVGLPARRHYRQVVSRLAAAGHPVVTVDAAVHGCFDGVAETSLPVADYEPESVTAALAAYHRRQPLAGVALFHEMTVVASTLAAAELGLPHFPVDRVDSCVDKLAMRRRMRECGVACPDFAEATTFDEAVRACTEIGYPAVVKPTRGGASYGVTRVDTEAALRTYFGNTGIFWEPRRFVVEAYLPGREVSVETVTVDGGRHVHLAVFDKPQSLEGPYFLEEEFVTPGWLTGAEAHAVRATVSDMVRRLGLSRCVTHTELRLTPGGPVVLEFGLRPIGWPGPLCVEAASGVDLVAVMAALACGEQIDLPRPAPVAAAGWRYLVVRDPGTVRRVPAVEGDACGGVLDASVWAAPGDRVNVPPRDFNYIKGYLAVTGDTADDVLARLGAANWELMVDRDTAPVTS
jgi:biotin carboxylase